MVGMLLQCYVARICIMTALILLGVMYVAAALDPSAVVSGDPTVANVMEAYNHQMEKVLQGAPGEGAVEGSAKPVHSLEELDEEQSHTDSAMKSIEHALKTAASADKAKAKKAQQYLEAATQASDALRAKLEEAFNGINEFVDSYKEEHASRAHEIKEEKEAGLHEIQQVQQHAKAARHELVQLKRDLKQQQDAYHQIDLKRKHMLATKGDGSSDPRAPLEFASLESQLQRVSIARSQAAEAVRSKEQLLERTTAWTKESTAKLKSWLDREMDKFHHVAKEAAKKLAQLKRDMSSVHDQYKEALELKHTYSVHVKQLQLSGKVQTLERSLKEIQGHHEELLDAVKKAKLQSTRYKKEEDALHKTITDLESKIAALKERSSSRLPEPPSSWTRLQTDPLDADDLDNLESSLQEAPFTDEFHATPTLDETAADAHDASIGPLQMPSLSRDPPPIPNFPRVPNFEEAAE